MDRETAAGKGGSEKRNGGHKPRRLVVWATREQKSRIRRAADLSGRGLTDFVLDSVLAAADETIRSHYVTQLTVRETEAFFAALANSPKLDEKMHEAAKRHQESVEVRW